ncbi:hypothetical protein [Tsuneonella suprasediminis]|uniref:hypothetical protein n=1 Tax=Tsuneonella suprasediminis TaxID=2306996 RepID=UPI002F92EC0C
MRTFKAGWVWKRLGDLSLLQWCISTFGGLALSSLAWTENLPVSLIILIGMGASAILLIVFARTSILSPALAERREDPPIPLQPEVYPVALTQPEQERVSDLLNELAQFVREAMPALLPIASYEPFIHSNEQISEEIPKIVETITRVNQRYREIVYRHRLSIKRIGLDSERLSDMLSRMSGVASELQKAANWPKAAQVEKFEPLSAIRLDLDDAFIALLNHISEKQGEFFNATK